MLTDTKLRNLKPKDKLYKVNDRDGFYVAITPAGSISFHYNYSIHGRQEAITFGRYGVGGITLAEARERLGEAKKMVSAGKSPAKEKARDKARVKDEETFGAWAEKWLRGYQMAESTRDMRRSVYERELKPKFGLTKCPDLVDHYRPRTNSGRASASHFFNRRSFQTSCCFRERACSSERASRGGRGAHKTVVSEHIKWRTLCS